MIFIRSSGYSGSIGKYAAPHFSIDNSPTTISIERFSIIPITSFSFIPFDIMALANIFAFSFSSLYVNSFLLLTIAILFGVFSTCFSNN